MKYFRYLYYFSYITYKWNFKLACFVIQHEIKGERKYGINTTGFSGLQKLKANGIDTSHATIYMPVSYYLLSKAFKHYPKAAKNNFVDIGSGKGRALCVAAAKGFNKVSGVDISADLCADAVVNLEHTKKIYPLLEYTLQTMDAVNYKIPDDADCIFFFNPFDEIIMKQVVYNIQNSLRQFPRNMVIIYANPLYENFFLDIGFKETYYTSEMDYLEMSILKI
jgi:SAM-dependent methyltransferase